MELRRAFLILFIAALSACASPNTAPGVTLDTTSAVPPATLDYMPVNNLAQYDAYDQNGNYGWLSQRPVIAPLSPNKNCARTIKGNIGDWELDGGISSMLVDPSMGVSATAYVVTKDELNNVYIVGSVNLHTNVESCHKRAAWVKAQMRVGQSWTYPNILGDVQIAQVIEYLPSASFLYYDPNTGQPESATYKRVFEIQYGSYFVIYWAPGYGAAHSVSTYPGVAYPYSTAFNWATSTPSPTPTATPTATPLLIHIGFQYGGADDPKFGYVYFYSAHSHAEVIQATHGQSAQFLNDDDFGTTHTASELGTTSFPPNFNNPNGHRQTGNTLDGSQWSTGDLPAGSKSQMFTVGPPGTYFFGCAFHYTQPPSMNNSSMGDVIVSS